MAEKDISLDKFTGLTAKDWIEWLEDYVCYAEVRKWNREKQVSNLRFFVTGDVRDCVRATTATELSGVDEAVQALLGGKPTSLTASQAIDSITYKGSVLVKVQQMRRWAKYVTKPDEVDQLVMLHLQRQLPVAYAEEVIKRDCQILDEAVKVIQGLERANQMRSVRHQPEQVVGRVAETVTGGGRREGSKEGASVSPQHPGPHRGFGRPPQGQRGGGQRSERWQPQRPPRQMTSAASSGQFRFQPTGKGARCFVCGAEGHFRRVCVFRNDRCGTCGKVGHLSPVCTGNWSRPATRSQ